MKHFYQALLLLTFIQTTAYSQSPASTPSSIPSLSLSSQSPVTLEDIISSIQAQELKFPFPQTDTTVLIGTINVNNNYPFIAYAADKYQSGTHLCCGEGTITYGPGGLIRTSPDYSPPRKITDFGGIVHVRNALRMKIRFVITNWNPSASSLTVRVGSQSATVPNGAPEVVLPNVLDELAPVSFFINNIPVTYNQRLMDNWYPGALKIEWNTTGSGILTLPVLPVTIVYAPVADYRKANSATASTTHTWGNTLTTSYSTAHSTTTPVPTSFQTIDAISKDMATAGEALKKDPDPYAQAAGEGLTTISSVLIDGLGNRTIDQTIANSVTAQQSLAVNGSSTLGVTAQTAVGGPGEGDVICFYRNARLVWYSHNGKMQLALLDHAPTLQVPNAHELKDALRLLAGKPAGTKDPKWQLDSASIMALLNLDPFTGKSGPFTELDPVRFTLANSSSGPASFQVGGGDVSETVTHQVTMGNLQATATTNTITETDKPGYLAFLGIGETNDQNIMATYTETASTQTNAGSAFTQDFVLHGDGLNDHYHCDVYFDNVFGTFAFREPADLDDEIKISGILFDQAGKIKPQSRVTLTTGDRPPFISATDKQGRFRFSLPYQAVPATYVVAGDSTSAKIAFTGKPIQNIRLKPLKK